jgi:hypothetical protein
MQHIGKITQVLLIVGGINWGLYALLNVSLVDMIFGSIPILAKVVYSLVALSGIYAAYNMVTDNSCCKTGK